MIVTVTAGDAAATRAAIAFYDVALGALGWVRAHELVDEEEDDAEVEAIGWGLPDGPARLWVVAGTPVTTGLHLRLAAGSRGEVETFHGAAVRNGGTSRVAPRPAPSVWAPDRRADYVASVADAAGNVLEAVTSP